MQARGTEIDNLFCAVREKNADLVGEMISANPYLVNSTNERRQTPIFIAAYLGYTEVIEKFIDPEIVDYIDIFLADIWGRSAYDAAIQCRWTNVARLLQPIYEPLENLVLSPGVDEPI